MTRTVAQSPTTASDWKRKLCSSSFLLVSLPHRYLSAAILDRLTVRIHSGLVEKGRPWLKLWYLLRGLDIQGSGFVQVSLEQVCQLLMVSSSTVRQWLREGKAAGAFRFWKYSQRQGLRVALGGLHQLCQKLDLTTFPSKREKGEWWRTREPLSGWGAVVEIPLFQLHQLRPLATAAVAQKLQQRSRHAAWQALPEEVRETYDELPYPEDFFKPEVKPHNRGLIKKKQASQSSSSIEEEQRPSDDPACGGIRCLIHIGKKRIFVSKGFIPFGTSQRAISWERNYCDRTVQRHLGQVLPHKQLVQNKAAYTHIREALRWDSPSIAPEPGICVSKHLNGRIVLSEISGAVGDKPYTQEVTAERFFRYGDRDWIYRTNLYNPVLQLRSMRASIRNYKRLLKNSKKISRRMGGDGFKEFLSEAEKDRHFP